MNRDVQLRALRAAARVAFSLSSVAVLGCGGATSEVESPPPAGSGTATANEPEKTASNDPGGKTTTPERRPAANDPPPTPPPSSSTDKSCEKIVTEAFPTPGMYPGEKKNVSAEVTSCCEKLLSTPDAFTFANRWDCCANVETSKDAAISIACTPWGPPVPPRMIAARQRSSDRISA